MEGDGQQGGRQRERWRERRVEEEEEGRMLGT